jgi:hypothetical protein
MSHHITPTPLRRVVLTIALTLTLLWLISEVLTATNAVQAQSNVPIRPLSLATSRWQIHNCPTLDGRRVRVKALQPARNSIESGLRCRLPGAQLSSGLQALEDRL